MIWRSDGSVHTGRVERHSSVLWSRTIMLDGSMTISCGCI